MGLRCLLYMMKEQKSKKFGEHLFTSFFIIVAIITIFFIFIKIKNDVSDYIQSQPVTAEVVEINGVNASNVTIKYKYNFSGIEYESTTTRHLEKIKKGDKTEIRVNTKEPKKILKYNSLSSMIFYFIAIALCIIGIIGLFCELTA